jgi:diaminopimelate decarboxylase
MSICLPQAAASPSVGGVPLAEIAERFGTPAYVIDEERVRATCREYGKALGPAEVAYAASAFWCRAMARWVAEEGLSLGVRSEGQLVVAGAAGFPAERILMHAHGRTPAELSSATGYGVSQFVVGSPGEIAQLAEAAGRRLRILLRVNPWLDAPAAPGLSSAREDQGLGFSMVSAEAAAAAETIRALPSVDLAGLYCHLGPNVSSIGLYEAAARRLVAFLAKLGGLSELNLGGGHAVAGRPGDEGLGIAEFAERVGGVVRRSSAAYGIPEPRLTIEPGRAIVGPAGLTLHRVLTVRRGPRTFVVVDGGLGDAAPDGWPVTRVGPPSGASLVPVTVVGGALIPDALLPGDIGPGDLLAVHGTGAYSRALTANDNQQPRPPVIAVRDGHAWPVIRRETDEDVLRRDVG